MSEPREWTLWHGETRIIAKGECLTGQEIEVIEKSAYDALKADVHDLLVKLSARNVALEHSKAENARIADLYDKEKSRALRAEAEVERLKGESDGYRMNWKDAELLLTREREKVAVLTAALVNIEICSSRYDASYKAREALAKVEEMRK